MTTPSPIFPSSAGDPVFKRCAPLLAALFVTTLYACSSWSNKFVYDDHEVIENLFPIHQFSDLEEIFRQPHYLNFPYYRPITRGTFALQKSIWGNNPRPYHLFNAGLAGLILLAAYGLLRRPVFGLPWPAAVVAALWFSLHPALSECVYPAASGRETLLPALLMLLAVWAYLHAGRRWYWLAIGLLAVALLCKEQAVVLPFIFLLADFLLRREKIQDKTPTQPGRGQSPLPLPSPGVPGEGRGMKARNIRSPWFLLLRFIPGVIVLLGYFFIRHRVLSASLPRLTIADHPLDPFLSLLYGVQTGLTPFIHLHYEPTFEVWFNPILCVISIFAIALLIFAVRRCTHPVRIAAAFWLGWFALLQMPTAHFLTQEAGYSERYCALAVLAFPAMVAMICQDRLKAISSRRAAITLALAWTTALAGISFARGRYYTDDGAFSQQWIATDPDSPTAHAGRGYWAQQARDLPTAIAEYQTARRLDPHLASARKGLADIYSEQGKFFLAAALYQSILHDDPRNVGALVNYVQLLGTQAYAQKDDLMRDQARDLLNQALAANPKYARAHFILAIWEQAFGTKDAAIVELKKALQLQPDFSEARKRLEMLSAN
jgi:tetratricopeptide (TPR) repeat protein